MKDDALILEYIEKETKIISDMTAMLFKHIGEARDAGATDEQILRAAARGTNGSLAEARALMERHDNG